MSLPKAAPNLPVVVEKPTPYTFDLGLLLANDPNPLPPKPSEAELADVARDGAQSLINQLLTTCKIQSTASGVLLSLPPAHTPLPREKPLPAAKAQTRWEAFAARRGIRPKTREQRRNTQYNEATGQWERRWGYKGANKAAETDWLVEVDPRKEAEREREAKAKAKGGKGMGSEAATSVRGDSRRERRERVRRNERRMRRNQRNADKA